MTNGQAEWLLKEYHQRISVIFLADDQTPYRICKQLWALHAEMERRIAEMVVGPGRDSVTEDGEPLNEQYPDGYVPGGCR